MGALALAELAGILEKVEAAGVNEFIETIAAAKRVALHGLGREGLQIRGLAMRLFHLGIDAHVVGGMTTPPLGAGDLLIVSAGPGDFATIEALMNIATTAGAKTAVERPGFRAIWRAAPMSCSTFRPRQWPMIKAWRRSPRQRGGQRRD